MADGDASGRLFGWKQIAGFVNASEDTAQRWARESGLPVRRIGSGPRARVTAERSELERWLDQRPDAAAESEQPIPRTASRAILGIVRRHWPYILLVGIWYGVLYGISVSLEAVYASDRLGLPIIYPSIVASVGTFASAVAAFLLGGRLLAKGRDLSLAASIGVLAGTAILLLVYLRYQLPAGAVVQAHFQTLPAVTAYLKNISYYLYLIIGWGIPPFLFIVAMEYLLDRGRTKAVDKVLTTGVAIKPAFFYPKWHFLAKLWALTIIFAGYMLAHLWESLRPDKHFMVYTILLFTRFVLFVGLGTICLFWYRRSLDAIRLRLGRQHPASRAPAYS
jgi:hypothetical protein